MTRHPRSTQSFGWIARIRQKFSRFLPTHSRTYSLTWEGVLVIVLMGVVGIAAWNSGTNLLYLLLATMIGMFLAHGLFALHFMNGLEIQRRVPPEAEAETVVPVVVSIQNTKRFLPAFSLTVRILTTDGQPAGRGFCSVVRPRSHADVEVPVVFPHRGWFELGKLDVLSRFPFGFAERGYTIRSVDRILVLPKAYPSQELLLSLGLDTGDISGEAKGAGVEPHSLRDYVPGEHVRNIHWKTSARLGRPMVLEYVLEDTHQVVLSLDPYGDEDEDGISRFEKAVVLTASLARALALRGYEVGLKTSEGEVAPGHGDRHHQEILRMLAMLPTTSDRIASPAPAISPGQADSDMLSVRIDHSLTSDQVGMSRDMRQEVTLRVQEWSLMAGQWRHILPAPTYSGVSSKPNQQQVA